MEGGHMFAVPGGRDDGAHRRAYPNGPAALARVVAYLQDTAEPVGPLLANEELGKAAQDTANTFRYTAGLARMAAKADRSTSVERAEKYGVWQVKLAEVCSFHTRSPEGIVAEMCLGDGDSEHKYLRDLLHPDYKVCGVGCGPHPTLYYACAVTLTGGFGPHPSKQHRAIVECAAGADPTERFLEVLNQLPDDDLRQEVMEQLQGGWSCRLKFDPESGAEVTFTDENGDEAIYNVEF